MVESAVQSDSKCDRKLRELVLFIGQRCETDPAFDMTKLSRLLFYADFLAYRRLNRAMTCQEYVKTASGPAPRRIALIVKAMQAGGDAVVRSTPYFDRTLRKLLPLREPDLSEFSVDEIVLVTQLIQNAWGLSAKEISSKSQHLVGWKLAKEQETIPYEIALVERGARSEGADRYALTLESLAEKAFGRRAAAE